MLKYPVSEMAIVTTAPFFCFFVLFTNFQRAHKHGYSFDFTPLRLTYRYCTVLYSSSNSYTSLNLTFNTHTLRGLFLLDGRRAPRLSRAVSRAVPAPLTARVGVEHGLRNARTEEANTEDGLETQNTTHER